MNEKELLKQKQRKWENDWHKKNYVQWNVKMTPEEKEELNTLIEKNNFISNRNFLQNSIDIINYFESGENNLYLIVIENLIVKFDDTNKYSINYQSPYIRQFFWKIGSALNYMNNIKLSFNKIDKNSFSIEEISIEKLENVENINEEKLLKLFTEKPSSFMKIIDYNYKLDDIKKIIINYDSLKRTISYFPRDIKTFVYKEIEED